MQVKLWPKLPRSLTVLTKEATTQMTMKMMNYLFKKRSKKGRTGNTKQRATSVRYCKLTHMRSLGVITVTMRLKLKRFSWGGRKAQSHMMEITTLKLLRSFKYQRVRKFLEKPLKSILTSKLSKLTFAFII